MEAWYGDEDGDEYSSMPWDSVEPSTVRSKQVLGMGRGDESEEEAEEEIVDELLQLMAGERDGMADESDITE